MTAKYKMSRYSFWSMIIAGVVGLGVVEWFVHWLYSQPGSGVSPEAQALVAWFLGVLWALIWILLGLAVRRQEIREARWKAGAQARREAAIRAQWERMAEVNKLVDKYGMDIGIIAYLLGEDPDEVERVVG